MIHSHDTSNQSTAQDDRMSNNVVGSTVVGLPIVNEVTNDGIITALELDQLIFFGLTWGAWLKVGMFIALVLLIVERSLSIFNKWKGKN